MAASWATRVPGALPRCTSQCLRTGWRSCTSGRTSRRRACPTRLLERWTFTADATLETGNAAEAEEDTAALALLLKHEFLDGGADDVTLATLGKVLLEPTLTTLGNFLVRSNSQSSVASASFTMSLSAFAWNIVRTYTLTPGRRYSFHCRYRLGTASNLVMYVSAADNDYVGVTGTFLGTASQGVWSTARLDFSVPQGGIAKLHFGAFGGSISGLVQQSAGTLDLTACRLGPQPSRESRSP